jgi:uncharacterized membrane protein
MDEELVTQPVPIDSDGAIIEPDDPGSELVANIESRIQSQFPDLVRRPELIQTIQSVVREYSVTYSGDIPPPQMLAEYERVCPGWAKRLLEQGEREQLARIDREKEEQAQTRLMIESETVDQQSSRAIESRGQIFGFVAFFIIAALGGMALYLNQTTVAITCFTTFALGVVGMFITGRKRTNPPDDKEHNALR